MRITCNCDPDRAGAIWVSGFSGVVAVNFRVAFPCGDKSSNISGLTDLLSKVRTVAFWKRQARTWHWMSGAICLVGMLLFAVTGITLNHAHEIEAAPKVEEREFVLSGAAFHRSPKAWRSAMMRHFLPASHAKSGVASGWMWPA